MHCYVWEYAVKPSRLSEFETGYGEGGDWVRLFRRDPTYLRTDLLRDRDEPNRFLTIDYWTSREACLAFRDRYRDEFDALDARFDSLTLRERHLGDFEVFGADLAGGTD